MIFRNIWNASKVFSYFERKQYILFPSVLREFSVLIKTHSMHQEFLSFVFKVVQEGYVSVAKAIYYQHWQFRKSTTNRFSYSGRF